MKLLIITGHGQNDIGASYGKFKESDMNRKVGIELLSYLDSFYDFKADFETENKKVDGEIELVRKGEYDIVFSIHFNAGGGDGFEVFINTQNSKAVKLAKNIESCVKVFGQNSRGIKDGMHLGIIRDVAPLSILVEGCFIDNSKDVELFDTDNELIKLARAYGDGIANYLGLKPAPKPSTKFYRVQVGAFTDKKNAVRLEKELEDKGYKDTFITFN